MTARPNDSDLNRVLDAWMDEGPMTAADTTLDRVMARIPTARQRRRPAGWWPRLPHTLRTQAPMLASVIVLVMLLAGLALAVGLITRPTPAPSPLPPASVSAPPARAASEAVVEEIRGPVPLRTFDVWVAKSRDASLGDYESDDLTGYTFTPDSTGRWFVIYLDPAEVYGEGETTQRDSLGVEIGWNFMNLLDPDHRGVGRFTSELGECELAFATFTETEISGTIDCVDVPGTYSVGPSGDVREGVIDRLLATFSFDPVADAYVP